MPATILNTSWYTAEQAAHDLEVPVEHMRALYKDILDGKHGRVTIAYHTDPTKPEIQGMDLKRLTGRLEPPSARHRNGKW